MDVRRIRDQKNASQLTGWHGPQPQLLMQPQERRDCYRNDDYFEAAMLQDEAMEGRGYRKRNVVSYNNGLSDDAWAMALEGEEDLQDVIERSREKQLRRVVNKTMRDRDSEGISSRNSPALGASASTSMVDGVEEKPKKKGRPPKNSNVLRERELLASSVSAGADDYESGSAVGKRKQSGKLVNDTLSVVD